MNSKERVCAVMDGEPVDRFPVSMTWQFLYVAEHLHELVGRPSWWTERLPYMPEDEYVDLLRDVYRSVPLDMIEPAPGSPSREFRLRQEFVEKDGIMYRHDTGTDEWVRLAKKTESGYPEDSSSNQERHVYTREQVAANIPVVPSADLGREGELDQREAVCRELGGDRFVMLLGPPGTLGMCDVMFGQTNTLMMLRDEPDLVDYVGERTAARGEEQVRRLAESGADGIYLYDHMSTADLISPGDYDRFCRPCIRRLVDAARESGLKTVVCYYGDVMDRLELLAGTGADAVQVECAMKGYVNDMEIIAETIGDRMTLFSNIDPVWCLERGTDKELADEIRRQVAVGRNARGFILGPASPITPGTPLARVQRFVDLCHQLGA